MAVCFSRRPWKIPFNQVGKQTELFKLVLQILTSMIRYGSPLAKTLELDFKCLAMIKEN